MVNMQWIAVEAIKPNVRNARTHSKKQIRQIADSIAAFGFLVPILIDQGGLIIAGHGRYAAAVLLGLQEVPVIRVEGLSEGKRRAPLPLPITKSARMPGGTASSWRPSCQSWQTF
jgi:ParB-like chromosome segregation protein Spo0J